MGKGVVIGVLSECLSGIFPLSSKDRWSSLQPPSCFRPNTIEIWLNHLSPFVQMPSKFGPTISLFRPNAIEIWFNHLFAFMLMQASSSSDSAGLFF